VGGRRWLMVVVDPKQLDGVAGVDGFPVDHHGDVRHVASVCREDQLGLRCVPSKMGCGSELRYPPTLLAKKVVAPLPFQENLL
jgi:hypothetical protein